METFREVDGEGSLTQKRNETSFLLLLLSSSSFITLLFFFCASFSYLQAISNSSLSAVSFRFMVHFLLWLTFSPVERDGTEEFECEGEIPECEFEIDSASNELLSCCEMNT